MFSGYMWLMDHLMYANRLDEAETCLEGFRQVDDTYRTRMYEGLICWHRGDREDAFAYWKQMEEEYPLDWHVFLVLGDMQARTGAYETAKRYYRKAIQIQSEPRYCDPYDSIAQVCELQGEYQEAIDVLNEELEVMAAEWNTSTGETSDAVRRTIARLEKKL